MSCNKVRENIRISFPRDKDSCPYKQASVKQGFPVPDLPKLEEA